MLFVLGGDDLEMETIKTILSLAGEEFLQPGKDWGDHHYTPTDLGLEVEKYRVAVGGPSDTSAPRDYSYEERTRIKHDPGVVFVECRPKDWPANGHPTVVDHHNERSGEPASVLQVLALLENRKQGFSVAYATRRWLELVAANDSGYIPALQALGATPGEIEWVRYLDRRAQGITDGQEAAGREAIKTTKTHGRVTVVRLDHNKTAVVADRLYGEVDQLLIFSPNEVNFYGDGALCAVLEEKFGGWCGGSGLRKPGEAAFWGCDEPREEEILDFIQDFFK